MDLDVSAVTEVDASFIQLLASCKKTAQDNHQHFQLINAPEFLSHKIDAMLMHDFFIMDSSAVEIKQEQEADEQISV